MLVKTWPSPPSVCPFLSFYWHRHRGQVSVAIQKILSLFPPTQHSPTAPWPGICACTTFWWWVHWLLSYLKCRRGVYTDHIEQRPCREERQTQMLVRCRPERGYESLVWSYLPLDGPPWHWVPDEISKRKESCWIDLDVFELRHNVGAFENAFQKLQKVSCSAFRDVGHSTHFFECEGNSSSSAGEKDNGGTHVLGSLALEPFVLIDNGVNRFGGGNKRPWEARCCCTGQRCCHWLRPGRDSRPPETIWHLMSEAGFDA